MKKLFFAVCLAAFSSLLVCAQKDYKRVEFYGGYVNERLETMMEITGAPEYDTVQGFEASVVVNVSRYLGIKGDVSGAHGKETERDVFSNRVIDTRNMTYNFLGGVQLKDNASNARLKPFGHLMVGAGNVKSRTRVVNCNPAFTSCADVYMSNTGFAGAVGGGLDLKVNKKFDFRLIQVDYNPVHIYSTKDNVRIGAGISF